MNKPRRKRLPERLWPDPHFPSDLAITNLITNFEISPHHSLSLRTTLGELVRHVQFDLDELRRFQTTRIKERLKAQVARIERVVTELSALNLSNEKTPGARTLSKLTSSRIRSMLNADYMPRHLSDELVGRDTSEKWWDQIIQDVPMFFLTTLLGEVKSILSETADAAEMPGGDRGAVIGRFLLSSFLAVYESFGPPVIPSTYPHGVFARFARDLLEAIGLPSDWVDSQLRAVIREAKVDRERTRPLASMYIARPAVALLGEDSLITALSKKRRH